MNRKLIFLDVDGTFTIPGTHTPPKSALAAVHAAQANGHRVFLCTGRNFALSKPLLELGLDGTVSSAGAYIVCGDAVLYDNPMPSEKRDRLLNVMQAAGVSCMLETRDCAYGETAALEAILHLGGNSEAERWKQLAYRPIEEYDGSPVYTIPFVCREAKQAEEAQQTLAEDFSLCLYDFFGNGCTNGELFLRGCDKGTGIQRVCAYLDTPLADTIGFGDSMNDYAMMCAVGVSVCMGNGSAALQAVSTRTCPPLEQDGLAEGFRILGLI